MNWRRILRLKPAIHHRKSRRPGQVS